MKKHGINLILLTCNGEEGSDDHKFVGPLDQNLRARRGELVNFLKHCKLMYNEHEDQCKWRWNRRGAFLIISLCKHLNNSRRNPIFNKVVWKIKAPQKVRAFLWLACNNAIFTSDNLVKQNCVGPDFCLSCNKQEETIDQTFLHCKMSKPIWEYFSRNAGLKSFQSHSSQFGRDGE